jgi:hypothetical protein
MDKSAIVGPPKRPWVGYVAIVVAALLGAFAVAMPAHSADLYGPGYGAPYGHGSYGPGPAYYEGAAYRPHCSPCGCSPCGCYQCGCSPCGCWRCAPIVHRRGVIERHWVHNEYFERRLDTGWPGGFAGGYGGPGYGGPRPHLGYGGVNYGPFGYGAANYGPSPISYEYDGPRPPVGIPGPYYGDGYE